MKFEEQSLNKEEQKVIPSAIHQDMVNTNTPAFYRMMS